MSHCRCTYVPWHGDNEVLLTREGCPTHDPDYDQEDEGDQADADVLPFRRPDPDLCRHGNPPKPVCVACLFDPYTPRPPGGTAA
ncbi:hypothetical protein BH23ACT9_BH23ACT9_34150 [soil metagenome]